MLVLTVPPMIHGCWLQNATVPRTVTLPSVLVISPRMAERRELLPAPTRPTTARSSPFCNSEVEGQLPTK